MPSAPKKHGTTAKLKALRLTANQRGYNYRWQVYSKAFLVINPYCMICKGQGRVAAATLVDHITPHRGDERLFWDEKNWQGLCHHCHAEKTGRGE